MDNSTKYDKKLIQKLFLSLMPAAIVIMLSNSVNSIVDGIVASNYIGSNAIAAIGFYTPFTSFLMGISTVISAGALIVTGNRIGKGDDEGAGAVFTTDTVVSFVIFLLFSVLMLAGALPAAKLLGAKGAALDDTAKYLRGIAFSFVPLYLGNHLNLFLELEQRHLRNYIGIGFMVLLNVIMDLLFVKVFKMGCFGLGLATSVACWVYLLILAQYYFTDKAQLKFDFSKLELSILPKVIVIGFPGAVLQIYLAVRGYVYNKSIIYYAGDAGMAAFAAVNSFSAVFFAFTNGIGVASRTLFSLFAGAEDRESIKTVAKVALYRTFPVNVGISVIFALMAGIFSGIYFNDPTAEEYRLAVDLFRICPFAVALSAGNAVFSALYQCQGRMKLVNIMSLMDGLLGVCLSLLILCPFLGIRGVWLAWLTNNFFVAAIVLVYTIIYNKKIPGTFDDWLAFKDNFGVTKDRRLNLSVHCEAEVVRCSEQVMDFLKKRGRDERHVYFTGLALEEMAGNIISHGYKKDKKSHHAVIECIDFEDKLVLHIMDDCVAFDPLSKDLIFNPEDPAKNMGIRMVQKLAREIKYYRMVGVNVLTITI